MLLDFPSFTKPRVHDCIAMQFTKFKIGSMASNIKIWTISWPYKDSKNLLCSILVATQNILSRSLHTYQDFAILLFFNIPYKSNLFYLICRIPHKHWIRYVMVIFTHFLYYYIGFLSSSLSWKCTILGLEKYSWS